MKVVILYPIEVPGHGILEPGPRELPDEVAKLLVERGYALPQGEEGGLPADEAPPDETPSRKRR